MAVNIFERASRKGLLFSSVQGNLSVTDLWELPITTTRANKASLENIGNALLQEQLKVGQESILGSSKQSPEQATLSLQIAIVKHIIDVRTAENSAKTAAAAKRTQLEQLDAIIAERKAKETPLEDLEAQRQSLISL